MHLLEMRGQEGQHPPQVGSVLQEAGAGHRKGRVVRLDDAACRRVGLHYRTLHGHVGCRGVGWGDEGALVAYQGRGGHLGMGSQVPDGHNVKGPGGRGPQEEGVRWVQTLQHLAAGGSWGAQGVRMGCQMGGGLMVAT